MSTTPVPPLPAVSRTAANSRNGKRNYATPAVASTSGSGGAAAEAGSSSGSVTRFVPLPILGLVIILLPVLLAFLATHRQYLPIPLPFGLGSASGSGPAPAPARSVPHSGPGLTPTPSSASPAWSSSPSSSSATPTPLPLSLILPPSDPRPHRHLLLPNHLEVILVHDPDCDKAAAAMDVGVGHLEDPGELGGLAHFCEHMLFLGTEKYPKENEYNTYLSAHNGHSNAYTDLCNTNYFFEVSPDALEGALDRFSGFFNSPLFSPSCTEREINAVNSEHKKNLQNDMWRFFQLEKHLASPLHPYSKFGTGNKETLWDEPRAQGRDTREELIEWWKEKYCARRMKLVVMGKDGLDVLERWVRERFETVPVRTREGEEKIVYSSEVYTEEEMGHMVFVEPVRDMRGLEISFPYPDQRSLYKSKPGSYLAHFLGHEGPGSILSYLKRKGWVNSLRAGSQNGSNGFEIFKIAVDLTDEGLVQYEEVAKVIFKYIHLLRTSKPSETIFNEIKALADIDFKFVERGHASSYVSDLARQLHLPVPREKVISAQWLIEEFNEEETAKSLALLDVKRANIAISSKKPPPGIGDFDRTEPIYGTRYRKQKMTKEFIDEALNGTLPGLHLPGQNAFIPEDIKVEKKEVAKPAEVPSLIKDTPLSKLWYKKDDRFWVPRANVFLTLYSPILQSTPRNAVLARLFVDLFRDSITEKVYDAELAGLKFSLEYAGDSLTIGSVGYNDKLPMLTEKMMRELKEYKVDPARFGVIVDQLKRNWENFDLEEPYSLVSYWAHYAESEFMWTAKEKGAELPFCTPEAVDAFAQEVFQRMYLESLIHGNMEKDRALELVSTVEQILSPRQLTESEKVGERSLRLPEASEHVWKIDVANPSNVNSAIEYYCEVGDVSDNVARPQLSLLAAIANEPAFNVLRTKEQLGYIVFSGSRGSVGTMGFRVLVQSERDSIYLETRIEAFFDALKAHLEQLSDEEFEKQRNSLIQKKTEKPKNLHNESSKYWMSIGDGYYDFERRFRDAEALKSVTKQQLIDMFMSKIHYSSPTRSKLSIHMRSTYKGVKFDSARALPLMQAFMAQQVNVSQADLGALMAAAPGLSEIQDFARKCLADTEHLAEDVKKDLETQVDALGDAAVKAGDDKAELRPGNIFIDNIAQFKAGLRPSSAAVPVQKFQVV